MMLSALEELSSPLSVKPISQSSSPTPLLAGERQRTSGYQSTMDDASLQGAVVGAGVGAGVDSGADEGAKNGRRYSIA